MYSVFLNWDRWSWRRRNLAKSPCRNQLQSMGILIFPFWSSEVWEAPVLQEWSETKVGCAVYCLEKMLLSMGRGLLGVTPITKKSDGRAWLAWWRWILTLEACHFSLPLSQGRKGIRNEDKWTGNQAGKKKTARERQGAEGRQEGQMPVPEDTFHWEENEPLLGWVYHIFAGRAGNWVET